MKKNYITPEMMVLGLSGSNLLELGSTIIVDPGSGGSQSGAEAKHHSMIEDDEEESDSIIKYHNDPLDFIPRKFTKLLED